MSEYSSCLSQFSSDHSSNLCFQMALQNTKKMSLSFRILTSPSGSPTKEKKVVHSVSNAKTSVDK